MTTTLSSSATARSILGPLTTAFTYPSSCASVIIQCSYCLIGWQAQTCGGRGASDEASCWPPRTSDAPPRSQAALLGWGFYSPGISCPVGYHTACSATHGVGGFNFQFPLTAGETAYGCCPDNYYCLNGGDASAQTCVSVVTTSSFTAAQCSGGSTVDLSVYDVPALVTVPTVSTSTFTETEDASVTETDTTTVVIDDVYAFSTISLVAPLFQIVFKAEDLNATTSTATVGSSSNTATNTHTNTGTSTPGSSGGLSSGAIAGIAVGCVVAGLGLLGAAIYLFIMRRKQQAQYAQPNPANPPPQIMPDPGMSTNPAAGAAAAGAAAGATAAYYQPPAPYYHQQADLDPAKAGMAPMPVHQIYEAPTTEVARQELP